MISSAISNRQARVKFFRLKKLHEPVVLIYLFIYLFDFLQDIDSLIDDAVPKKTTKATAWRIKGISFYRNCGAASVGE